MSMFAALNIANTGVDAMQAWIDTAGANAANANDAVATNQPAYAEQTAVLSPMNGEAPGQTGGGVEVEVTEGSTTGLLQYDPQSPLADTKGDVKVPDVSISDQLVGLIQAQSGYTANTDVMSKAVAAYQAGLTIGS